MSIASRCTIATDTLVERTKKHHGILDFESHTEIAEGISKHVESRTRDKTAQLAALYETHYDRIARYAFVRLRNQADAEDLAGEVFLKALESLDSYRERGVPMQAWLFRIAHNALVDRFRKSAKHKTVSVDEASLEVEAESDPEEQALAGLEMERVMKALGSLTESQRRVIELRFFAELTSEEAGHVLKKRAEAVRKLQSSALMVLRSLLEEGQPQRMVSHE